MDDAFKEKLEQNGVDLKVTLQRFMGNEMLYERFLKKFLADENFAKIAPAFAVDDNEEALRAAHTLKGVSANLGMMRLYEASSHTVDLIRADKFIEARQSYDAVKAEYEAVCAVIQTLDKAGA